MSSRRQLREKMQSFPSDFVDPLLSPYTSILVCILNHSNVVAACGIQSPFNYVAIYVEEGYRGRGVGMRILKKAIYAAKRRNLSFINLNVFYDNVPALRLYSKLGFRETVAFPMLKSKNMMLPLNLKGEIAFLFLHKACSLIPEPFLIYIMLFLKGISKRIRHQTSSLA